MHCNLRHSSEGRVEILITLFTLLPLVALPSSPVTRHFLLCAGGCSFPWKRGNSQGNSSLCGLGANTSSMSFEKLTGSLVFSAWAKRSHNVIFVLSLTNPSLDNHNELRIAGSVYSPVILPI